MNIRPAEQKDIAQISHILTTVWKKTYQGIFPQAFLDELQDQGWQAGLEASLQNVEHFWVALQQEQVVAMLVCGKARKAEFGEGEIYAINVLPTHQQSGIGKALLQKAVEQLSKKHSSIYLCVAAGNTAAQQFYLKQGFKDSGQTTVREMPTFRFDEKIFTFSK